MNSELERVLKETWEKKEKFYEDTKDLTIMEILEIIEGKKFYTKDKLYRSSKKSIKNA